jgi:hypothetical protein
MFKESSKLNKKMEKNDQSSEIKKKAKNRPK